jgi:hypothetical protein
VERQRQRLPGGPGGQRVGGAGSHHHQRGGELPVGAQCQHGRKRDGAQQPAARAMGREEAGERQRPQLDRQPHLDAAHHRLGDGARQPLEGARAGQQQHHRAHDEPAGGQQRRGQRAGDGDGRHGLERLHRHGEAVGDPRGHLQRAEEQERHGGVHPGGEHHPHQQREVSPQVAEGAGQLLPGEAERRPGARGRGRRRGSFGGRHGRRGGHPCNMS